MTIRPTPLMVSDTAGATAAHARLSSAVVFATNKSQTGPAPVSAAAQQAVKAAEAAAAAADSRLKLDQAAEQKTNVLV